MSVIFLDSCNEAAKITKCCCKLFTATNENDVAITGFICITIVIIAFVSSYSILAWKKKEIDANEKERKFNKEKEEAESDCKQKADKTNRNWQLEDENRKHELDLLTKKLDILQELCYNNSDGIKAYIDAINDAIKQYHTTQSNQG